MYSLHLINLHKQRNGYGANNLKILQTTLMSQQISDTQWKNITYMIFNTLDPSLRKLSYVERQTTIQNIIGEQSNVKVISFKICEMVQDMYDYLEQILEKGGEGIIIHEPNVPYIPSITSFMWKMKVIFI